MKPMTEQERQELIKHTKEMLELMKSYSSNNGYSTRSIQVIEIALASLTAESVRQFIYNNPYEEGYIEWVDCNEEYFNGVPDDCRRIVYTAPPVPVIKFPDHEIRELVNELTETAKKYAGAQCIRDALSRVVTKRLNGLGE